MRFTPDKPITGLLASMLREAASANFTEDLPAGVQKQFAASLLDLLAATIQVQMAGCDPEPTNASGGCSGSSSTSNRSWTIRC